MKNEDLMSEFDIDVDFDNDHYETKRSSHPEIDKALPNYIKLNELLEFVLKRIKDKKK